MGLNSMRMSVIIPILFSSILFTSCTSLQRQDVYVERPEVDSPIFTPQKNVDQSLLDLITDMGTGERRGYGNNSVISGLEYYSASGLKCKPILITRTDGSVLQRQLACQLSSGWAFMQNVMSYNKRFE